MSEERPEPGAESSTGVKPEPGAKSSGVHPEPGGERSGAERTFTQEQVDTFLARERAKFPDYDGMRTRLAELEAANQTELERAQAQAKDADARAASAITERNRLVARSALTSAAARAGALDPEVCVALLADAVTVDERGAVAEDVDKLVTTLLDEKPYLRNGAAPHGIGSADQGAHTRGAPKPETASRQMDTFLRG
jgi:hypothetical protein